MVATQKNEPVQSLIMMQSSMEHGGIDVSGIHFGGGGGSGCGVGYMGRDDKDEQAEN